MIYSATTVYIPKLTHPEEPSLINIPLFDALQQRHPDMLQAPYSEAVRQMTAETALHTAFPDERYEIARRLLFHGLDAALTTGFFEGDRTLEWNNDDERCWQSLRTLFTDLKGHGIHPLTSDFLVRLVDIQSDLYKQHSRGEDSHQSIYDQTVAEFWSLNNTSITRQEAHIIRKDIVTVAETSAELLFNYLKQREMATLMPARQHIRAYRTFDFPYMLGVRARGMTDSGATGWSVLRNLTNRWQVAFNNFYTDRGLPVPPFRFINPNRRHGDIRPEEMEYDPLPFDMEYKDREPFNLGGIGYDYGYDEVFSVWNHSPFEWDQQARQSMVLQQFDTWKAKEIAQLRREDRSDLIPEVNKVTLFHVWISALERADYEARRKTAARQLREHPPEENFDQSFLVTEAGITPLLAHPEFTFSGLAHVPTELARKRDQFAQFMYETMKLPQVWDTIPLQLQELVPFFAHVDSIWEDGLADID